MRLHFHFPCIKAVSYRCTVFPKWISGYTSSLTSPCYTKFRHERFTHDFQDRQVSQFTTFVARRRQYKRLKSMLYGISRFRITGGNNLWFYDHYLGHIEKGRFNKLRQEINDSRMIEGNNLRINPLAAYNIISCPLILLDLYII